MSVGCGRLAWLQADGGSLEIWHWWGVGRRSELPQALLQAFGSPDLHSEPASQRAG